VALRKSLAWMAFSQSSSFLLQFLAAVVLARYLSPYEMGIYTLAAAIIGVLSLMQALGLQSLLVRETHLTPEIIATAFTVNAILALILSSVIVTASLLGSSLLGSKPEVSKVLLILALN
jgi:O-antigen/teichoic acid export membrane protein